MYRSANVGISRKRMTSGGRMCEGLCYCSFNIHRSISLNCRVQPMLKRMFFKSWRLALSIDNPHYGNEYTIEPLIAFLTCLFHAIYHVRNLRRNFSKSRFTINLDHFLPCIDADYIIAEYLQNPKRCHIRLLSRIKSYIRFFDRQ